MPLVPMEELVSGGMVKGHVDALRDRLGAADFDRAIAALTADQRAELLVVTAVTWVRIATVEALYAASAPGQGLSVADLHTQVASIVVGRTVSTLWRALLRLATDEMLFSRSPSIFAKAYRQGRLEVVRVAAGSAELRIVGWPSISEFALRGFRVGVESTLRTSGRRDPRGVASRTTDGALIRVTWSGGR